MAESWTTRFGLRRWTAGGDTPSRDEFDTSFANLESKAAGWLPLDTAANRPAAAAANARMFFLATDTLALSFSDGSNWREVGVLGSGITVDLNGEQFREANLAAYTEKIVTSAAAGASYACDASVANVFDLLLSQACTISVSNVPNSTDKATTITILVRNGASAYAVTWPSSFKWAGGSAPTLSGVNKQDMITATTFDGGTTWAASVVANFASVGQ